MSKTALVIILTVIVAAIIGVGFWFSPQNQQKCAECSAVPESLQPPMFQSWVVTAYGKISSIAARTVVIGLESQTATIIVPDDAEIFFISFLEAPQPNVAAKTSSAPINFSELKVGDNISLVAELKANGELSAKNISKIGEFTQSE